MEESPKKSKVWHLIRPESRVRWDMLVFFVIVLATFEIPYNLLVGYKNDAVMHAFNLLFYIVFGFDMVLNSLSIRRKTYDGFWGWRKAIGWLIPALSSRSKMLKSNPEEEEIWIRKQPQVALAYFTSFWFLIDFLAVFPFELTMSNLSFLGMSRALRLFRLPRLIRMVRAIRAIKAFKAYRTVQHAFKLNPATGRFIMISIFVPWMMHIIACLIFFFEAGAPNAEILSYTQALDAVFLSFIANDDLSVVTYGGEIMEKLAIVLGFTFFGVFIGNFASYFENMDAEKLLYEEKKKDWEAIFKAYPEVFDKSLKRAVLHHTLIVQAKDESAAVETHVEMIRELDHSLESRILGKMKENEKKAGSNKIDKFLQHYSNFQA